MSDGLPAGIPNGFTRSDHGSPFMDTLGPLYDSGEGENYKLGMFVEHRHSNRIGLVHGAVLAALADVHLLRMIALTRTPRLTLVTTHLALDFLSSAAKGAWLEASGRIDRIGRSLCHSSGLIHADGKPVVRMSGVFQILKD